MMIFSPYKQAGITILSGIFLMKIYCIFLLYIFLNNATLSAQSINKQAILSYTSLLSSNFILKKNLNPPAPSDPDINITIDPDNPVSTPFVINRGNLYVLSICMGTKIRLRASSTGVGTLVYTWFNPADNSTYGTGTELSGQLAEGQYVVRISDSNGTTVATTTVQICINNTPPVNVSISSSTGSTDLCSSGAVPDLVLTAQASNTDASLCSPPAFTYQWFKNNSPIAGASNKTLSIANNTANAGNYSVRVSNGCGFNSASVNLNIVSSAPIAANISSEDGSNKICAGGILKLNANFIGIVDNYQWFRFGNANPIATGASYTATVSGTYKVKASNGCGSSESNFFTVILETAPNSVTTAVSGETTFCKGGSVLMAPDAFSGGLPEKYEWFKDGVLFPSDNSNVAEASESGTYKVKASNKCGAVESLPIVVKIVKAPTELEIKPIGPPSLSSTCNPMRNNVTLNALSDGENLSYEWYKNGSLINGANTAAYIATTVGAYKVKAIGRLPDNTLCGEMESAELIISESVSAPTTPTLSSGGITNTCTGSIVMTANNQGNGTLYEWFKDAVLVASTISPTFRASAGGSYTVRAVNACGTSPSSALTLNINLSPSDLSIETPAGNFKCGTGFIPLNAVAKGSNLNYQWFRNGVQVGTGISFNATLSGTYMVKASNACGQLSSAPIEIKFIIAPQAGDVKLIADPCSNPVKLSVQTLANFLNYEWYFFNGVSNDLVGNQPIFYASQSGVYSVKVSNLCNPSGIFSLPVNVSVGNNFVQPIISALGATGFCSGDSVKLKAITSNVGVNYRWFRNNQLIPNENKDILTAKLSGNYTIETYTGTCSKVSAALPVFVIPSADLLISFIGKLTFCEGDSVVLKVRSQDNSFTFQWFLEDVLLAGGNTYTAKKVGKYKVKGTNACGAVVSRLIEINTKAVPKPKIIIERSLLISADSSSNYQWNFNGFPILDANERTLLPLDSGRYTLTIANELGCLGTSEAVDWSGLYLGVNKSLSVMPNPSRGTFSILVLSAESSNIALYNDTGKLIFEKNLNKQNSIASLNSVDIQNLSPGMYLLRAYVDGKYISGKIIIQ